MMIVEIFMLGFVAGVIFSLAVIWTLEELERRGLING